jgi:hypothetical protein
MSNIRVFVKTYAFGCCYEQKLADAVLSILIEWSPGPDIALAGNRIAVE